MKRYKLYPEETPFYYSTCTIVNWLPVFQKDEYFRIIIDSLKYCQTNKGLVIHGYVIMPTHLHLITYTPENISLADIMRDFKHYTSTEIVNALKKDKNIFYLNFFEKAADKRSPKQAYKVWQDEYHPIALKSEKWFNQKLNYIHANPVRKGFVEYPEHWKYSSARNWLCDDDSIIEIQRSLGEESP